MKKIFLIPVAVIVLIGLCSYYYVMYGGARDLSSEETAFTVTSTAINNEFTNDLEGSNKKYLEKAVAISGTITKLEDSLVTLDHNIICTLKNPNSVIKNNQPIVVKGRIVGYDDLLGELKLDQCFIIK
jgi:hypothetical protein